MSSSGNPTSGQRIHGRKIWRRVAAAVLFFMVATGFNTCGEGKLPPRPPPNTGTINVLGEAV